MVIIEYLAILGVHILVVQAFQIDDAQEIWSECSLSCGGGIQYKLKDNKVTRICNTMGCPGDAGCISSYLSFENSNDKMVFDDSKNGNLGTMTGMAKIVKDGKFGKALRLTRNGSVSFDVVNFKNRPTLAITIALWLKLTDTSGLQEVFFTCGKSYLYNVGAYHLGVEEGKVTWSLKDSEDKSVFSLTSDKPMKKSKWYHIAGTYRLSSGEANLYINGKVSKKTSVNKLIQADDIWACADVGSSPNKKPVEGYVDEFYIFKCALLPQEVSELYSKNQFKKFIIPTPGRYRNTPL